MLGSPEANRTGRTSIASRGVAHDLLDGSATFIIQTVWSQQVSEVHARFRTGNGPELCMDLDLAFQAGMPCIGLVVVKPDSAIAISGGCPRAPLAARTGAVAAEIMASNANQEILVESK